MLEDLGAQVSSEKVATFWADILHTLWWAVPHPHPRYSVCLHYSIVLLYSSSRRTFYQQAVAYFPDTSSAKL